MSPNSNSIVDGNTLSRDVDIQSEEVTFACDALSIHLPTFDDQFAVSTNYLCANQNRKVSNHCRNDFIASDKHHLINSDNSRVLSDVSLAIRVGAEPSRHSWDDTDHGADRRKRLLHNNRWTSSIEQGDITPRINECTKLSIEKHLSISPNRGVKRMQAYSKTTSGNATQKRDGTTMLTLRDATIDSNMLPLSSSPTFSPDQNTSLNQANITLTPKSKSVDDGDCNPFQHAMSADDALLPNTTWSGFVTRKRNDAISHCKSVLEVHDRTHKTIRAAVQMISDNLSPRRNRSNDEAWSSAQNVTDTAMLTLKERQVFVEENDEYLSNFMYCPRPLNDEKPQLDQNDNLKIESEGDTIIISPSCGEQHNDYSSRFPCGIGMYALDDFRQDYCCGAADNYDTLINSLRKQQTSYIERQQAVPRPSSLHIVGTNSTNCANGSPSYSSPFLRFERSMADPESWVDIATEKIDSIIDHLMGGGHGTIGSRRRFTNLNEIGSSGRFVYQAPLLKKPTGKR
jgi:hypothetical protein